MARVRRSQGSFLSTNPRTLPDTDGGRTARGMNSPIRRTSSRTWVQRHGGRFEYARCIGPLLLALPLRFSSIVSFLLLPFSRVSEMRCCILYYIFERVQLLSMGLVRKGRGGRSQTSAIQVRTHGSLQRLMLYEIFPTSILKLPSSPRFLGIVKRISVASCGHRFPFLSQKRHSFTEGCGS